MVDENKKENLEKMKALCRVIKCDNIDLIPNIVKANNTQNEITSWDRYDGIGIYTVAQPVFVFEGNYTETDRGVNNIFDQNSSMRDIFC